MMYSAKEIFLAMVYSLKQLFAGKRTVILLVSGFVILVSMLMSME